MAKYYKYLYVFPIIAALMAHSYCQAKENVLINTSTVRQLDVPRFMGKWYEIARYDHPFEKDMTHVTAEYSLEAKY